MVKDLRSFLREYEAQYPEDVIHVQKGIDSNQEITEIGAQLGKQAKYPLLFFHNVLNAEGKKAEQPVLTNVLASRTRYARICNSNRERLGRDVYEAIKLKRVTPEIISKADAPVKEIIKTEEDINLYSFPILVHNDMDAGRYFSSGFFTSYDPDSGIDNCALQRGWANEKDMVRAYLISGTHNERNLRKHELLNRDMKCCFWLGHHPLAYIGGQAKLPYPCSHWDAMGGMLGEPLRLVTSESLGDEFLVPADAEVIVEGVITAHERFAEGPFGENPGYLGPQKANPQLKVTAITHRKDAIWHDVAAGRADHQGHGSPPLEGLLWESLKIRFSSLEKVYVPISGTGRYHVYLQFKNPAPGEARQAISMALNIEPFFAKHIFCFDDDIDIFDPAEVMWAIATRSQWGRDIVILPSSKWVSLDPSQGSRELGDIGGIDCTKHWEEPFEERVTVNPDIMARIKVENFISPKVLHQVKIDRI